ncbi:MAG TPA: autotransporter domain-containing protein [Thermomonas sp.]|jgi:outer membrane lipase/esterase|nr:autotransporter domain-containing protein [Thermomonas sp.]HPM56097.1 autotransporter domain-containing protein [Thermomonas sp.]
MKATLRRTLLTAAIALAAAPAFAGPADSPFTQTIFFGDSLTDGGFFRSLLPPSVQNVTGQFTTNPGYVWSQYLADYYDSNADVAWKATGATPTLSPGGNNWAVGGARTGTDSVGALGYTPSLASQYARYLSSGNTVDPNALYTVWGGANDLFAVQANPAQAQAIIGGAVTAQIGLVGALTQAGAQYILVPTIPDLGLTPSSRAGGAVAMAQGTALTNSYNSALFGGLASAGLHVIPLDTFHFLQEVVANPGAYGITNVTGTACQPQITAQSLTCNPTSLVNPGAPNSYLFADGVHPTSGAHKVIGDFAISVIEGPRQIAILPRSASMVGRARSQVVDSAVSGMLLAEGDGTHWWADIRGDQQRSQNPGFDGPGLTGSIGIGWRSGNLTYGAFAGYGRQDIDFGERRGDFRQTDAGVGGFIGWKQDAMWATGQLSWTKLGYDVHRQVNLGQASRVHSGSPDGDNLSAGASAGWNFGDGALVHGPVVSVLAQKISVDGYVEDSTESTALAYLEQDGDSLIGSVGWQASFAINDHVKPYARLTWDREFEDAPTQAFAQSVSMPGTLPYAVPGLPLDDTYGTLTYGVQSKLLGLDITTGSNITVGQKGGNDASFFLTVSGKF